MSCPLQFTIDAITLIDLSDTEIIKKKFSGPVILSKEEKSKNESFTWFTSYMPDRHPSLGILI